MLRGSPGVHVTPPRADTQRKDLFEVLTIRVDLLSNTHGLHHHFKRTKRTCASTSPSIVSRLRRRRHQQRRFLCHTHTHSYRDGNESVCAVIGAEISCDGERVSAVLCDNTCNKCYCDIRAHRVRIGPPSVCFLTHGFLDALASCCQHKQPSIRWSRPRGATGCVQQSARSAPSHNSSAACPVPRTAGPFHNTLRCWRTC